MSLLVQPAATAAATAAVAAGQCIVLPTDTVYGIGADALNAGAVQALLNAKGRGRDMPPPVLLPSVDAITEVAADVSSEAYALAARFWPGALTLILRAGRRLDLGDRPDTVAVRVPAHDAVQDLLTHTGLLAVSSANLSGMPPATTVDQAVAMLGDSVAVYLDGGPTPGEMPSTIVDLSGPGPAKLVRQGVISLAALRTVCPCDGLTGQHPGGPTDA